MLNASNFKRFKKLSDHKNFIFYIFALNIWKLKISHALKFESFKFSECLKFLTVPNLSDITLEHLKFPKLPNLNNLNFQRP